MPSQTIGRYEIERELGEGGMAVVYLAYDPNFDRPVVVKVIKREYSGYTEFRARFSREARVIAKLEHEAIVPVYDFGEHDGQPFIVMRHMTGGTLADRLAAGPMPLAETANVVARIADALDHAHSKGIIHRDLKPGNILFDERGKAYLSDFGIAKSAEATTKLTGTAIIGTPAYMSPEQVQAVSELDRRSDVYSLGVMVFELLTGELPYKARDALGLLFAHVNTPVPDVRQTRPDLPRESDSLIKRAMAKKPDDRYATTGELAADLSKIATKPSKGRAPVERPGGSPRPAGSGLTPPPPAQRTRPDTPPPAGDLRPTGVIVEPERPARSQRPRRSDLPAWLLPAALVAVLCLAASIGGAFALPALFAQRTPQATDVAAISTNDSTTQPPNSPTIPPPTRTPNPPTPTHTLTPTLQPTPAPGIGSTQISEKDGMVMVFVPAGEFTMGSNDGDSDERPMHTVRLDAFWIDQTEVTNGMFAKFIAAMGYKTDAEKGGCSDVFNGYSWRCVGGAKWDHPDGPNSTLDGLENHPVVHVSWNDASAYCEWAGRRLPTETEWEKAASWDELRQTKYKYPWGDSAPAPSLLNSDMNVGDTIQVGSYPDGASPYGAMDMAGNVFEWVNDWYDENYYDNSPSENPPGPSSGRTRVIRGSGWDYGARYHSSAARGGGAPVGSGDLIGFRCSLSP